MAQGQPISKEEALVVGKHYVEQVGEGDHPYTLDEFTASLDQVFSETDRPDRHSRAVRERLERLRIDDEAARLFRAEKTSGRTTSQSRDGPCGPASGVPLILDSLDPGWHVRLRAAHLPRLGEQLGKTTLCMQCYVFLVDKRPSLGISMAQPVECRIAVFNYAANQEQFFLGPQKMEIVIPGIESLPCTYAGRGILPSGFRIFEDQLVEWLREGRGHLLDSAHLSLSDGGTPLPGQHRGRQFYAIDEVKKRAGIPGRASEPPPGRMEQQDGASARRYCGSRDCMDVGCCTSPGRRTWDFFSRELWL